MHSVLFHVVGLFHLYSSGRFKMDRYFIASGDLLDSLSELAVVKFLGI